MLARFSNASRAVGKGTGRLLFSYWFHSFLSIIIIWFFFPCEVNFSFTELIILSGLSSSWRQLLIKRNSLDGSATIFISLFPFFCLILSFCQVLKLFSAVLILESDLRPELDLMSPFTRFVLFSMHCPLVIGRGINTMWWISCTCWVW